MSVFIESYNLALFTEYGFLSAVAGKNYYLIFIGKLYKDIQNI